MAILAAVLAGCNVLPEKPPRATLYDFGPVASAQPKVAPPAREGAAARQPIALADIETNSRLDGTQLLYRLGYADANELRPYSQARWSQPPAQLFAQRLRDALAESRTVLDPIDAGRVARSGEAAPAVLRITLEDFTHNFESPERSFGVVRLRATLSQRKNGAERVLGQRLFTERRPAPTADAAGGVKALGAASDAAVAQIVQWVDEAGR